MSSYTTKAVPRVSGVLPTRICLKEQGCFLFVLNYMGFQLATALGWELWGRYGSMFFLSSACLGSSIASSSIPTAWVNIRKLQHLEPSPHVAVSQYICMNVWYFETQSGQSFPIEYWSVSGKLTRKGNIDFRVVRVWSCELRWRWRWRSHPNPNRPEGGWQSKLLHQFLCPKWH